MRGWLRTENLRPDASFVAPTLTMAVSRPGGMGSASPPFVPETAAVEPLHLLADARLFQIALAVWRDRVPFGTVTAKDLSGCRQISWLPAAGR